MGTALSGNRRIYTRVGIALAAQMLLGIGLQFAVQWVVSYLGYRIEAGSWGYYMVALLPQYLVAMPISYIIIMQIPAQPGIPKIKLTPKQLGIIALVCLALMYAGNLVGTVVTMIISALSGNQMVNLLQELVNKTDMWVGAVVMVLIAPVVEELFFRKLLIGRLRGYGQRAAIVVSAVAFGLSHGNLSQVFYAFGLGLAFGYVYTVTNNIGYTIALHMAINFLGSVVAPLLLRAGMAYTSIYALIMLTGVIIGGVQFFRLRKQIRFSDEWWFPPAAWKKPALANAGMIAFYGICAVIFVLNTWWALQP